METLNGTEGENIPLADAIQMTSAFRAANPRAIKAFYIGRDIMNELLKQENCVGMRIYNALDVDNQAQVVIVGVTADNVDLYEGIRADKTKPCPTLCDNNSPLNQ